MAKLVDHLANLTGFRDRDLLDVTLVSALRDLIDPQTLAIHRLVGEPGQQRWLTRARLAAGDVAATTDPVGIEFDELPALDELPARRDCMHSRELVALSGTPCTTLFPLATDRDVVGVLEVLTSQPMSVSAQRTISSILRIYRNFEALLDYSERDTLTGLLNRKTFDEAFLKMVSQTGGSQAAAAGVGAQRRLPAHRHWIGVIDIDHFKRVNDTYGHLIGDEVLLLLSRLMRSSFRFDDRLYRFGGEEFVALMRCGTEGAAAQAFERLRANTEQYAFPQVGRITVSVGFTEVRPGDAPSAAFERADKAIYFAKEHGRNQVRNHAALVDSGDLQDDGAKVVGGVELF
jgi:diguanylate cyclase (GGDEF)-like protein